MSIQKLRTSILIAVGVVGIAAAGLLAGRLSAGAFREQHSRSDFPARVFAHVSRSLSLTDQQKAKVKDVLRAHADEIRAQMLASSAARAALRNAVMEEPTDENRIRAAAKQIGQTQGDSALLLAKIRAEIDPVLTAEQKARVQQFHERARQHGQNAAQSFDAFLKSNP